MSPNPPQSEPPVPGRTARGRGVLAVFVATLALTVAVAALAVSCRALGQADEALALKNAAGPEPQPAVTTAAAVQPPAVATTSAERPNATGAPPPLTERTVYAVKYQRQALTMSARCSYSMYADLDEPRSNVSSTGSDLQFDRGCTPTDPSTFVLGNDVDGSTAVTATSTPQECADKIRTAPVGEAPIPVRQGVSFCFTTSYAAARARGDKWRIVLITVTGVAEDGMVTVEASAWDAPS